MKYLKMLGLAAVLAMALAAFAGASTASAAKLCKTAPNKSNVCEGGHYPSGTEFHATSTDPKLTVVGSGFVSSVTCNHSTVVLKSTATEGASGVPGEVTDVTFTEDCTTNSGVSCTVSTTSGYTGTLAPTSGGNGTLSVNGTAKTKVVCGGIFSCEYQPTETGLNLGFTGGNPAKVTANAVTLKLVAGGFGCGTGASWDATYTLKATVLNGVTTPTALWVSAS